MKKWYSEADMVILHGTIYTVAITCDEVKEGKSEFLIIRDGGAAVKDGKIIAVGSAQEMDALIGEHTQILDATGKVVSPGFCESHMHASFYGAGLLKLDLSGVTKRGEIFAKLAEKAAETPDGKWIEGVGWNNMVWDDQTMISCHELDAVSPDNPVFLMSTTYHTVYANSAALRIAGITRDSADPEGGGGENNSRREGCL
ncbi:MAG: amidohydrolase family protein [Clostridiales bacterium]|nr:amidohydrolase family protein [Clostridiales bacterium]